MDGSINNIYLNNEEKKRYVPISSITNNSSIINNIFESQINRIMNKKNNMPKLISSIQKQSRQKLNKYISNPSCDNILQSKKTKTLDSHKKKNIQNKYNYNNHNINNININNIIKRLQIEK